MHPFDVAVYQPHDTGVRGLRSLQITVAQGGLVFERSKKQGGDQPFFVAEVMVDGADAGLARHADHLDGRGLDPLRVEAVQGLTKDGALHLRTIPWVAAL